MKSVLSFLISLIAFCSYSQNNADFHLNKEYKIDPNGTVKLTTSDAKVTITGSHRTTALVKIDRTVTNKGIVFGHEEFAIDVNETGGSLEIRERSNSVSLGIIGYHHEKYTISIEVPDGAGLAVKGDDGDYWIKNIGGAISFRVDDADVELTGCKGDRFEFQMDDGDLKMDEGRGKLEINGDDTDVHIQHAAFTDVRAKLDDGDLIIETSIADNGNYFMENVFCIFFIQSRNFHDFGIWQ